MNSFELNKILGAILGTCLITLALNITAGAIFAPEKPAKPGYEIAVKEESGGEKAGAKEPEVPVEGAAGLGLDREGPADRQAVPGLPHLRKGRPQPGRTQSLGYRRQCSAAKTAAASISPPR